MRKKESKEKCAWTVKVGEKGQIVLPKEARDMFGVQPGDTLLLLGDVKQGLAIPPKSMFMKAFAAVFGREADEDEEGEL